MDLSCGEHLDVPEPAPMEVSSPTAPAPVLYAPVDPVISTDPRVIPNLLILERTSVPHCDYFQNVQDDIQPFMRKVVTTWMLEVCEEQRCEEQVFPLAVNYLDRALCALAIPRHQLQLLASAALLLASKIRQGAPLPVLLLCAYTDNSITPNELRHWEMLVLQMLGWQTSAVTAFDFVEHVLARTNWTGTRELVRRHAHTLAALCYTETDFMHVLPSLTATACVLAAARGLGARVLSAGDRPEDALGTVCALASVAPAAAEAAVLHVERIVARETAPPKACAPSPADPPGTPTDVQDVLF